ncbi:hypothetical protein QQS21_001236 [Conoideocrella luteorostrata]|uniref:Ankyrin n=1 Tax=Conoideocrella luteorostrata TaxID=1105319 RepID=A0AAJ0D014_9HYPO|nr:hypothetical protein QQS21_001236 [Conoideocrella luteorostrata]
MSLKPKLSLHLKSIIISQIHPNSTPNKPTQPPITAHRPHHHQHPPTMDGFSVASLTSLCSTIAQQVVSSTSELQSLLQTIPSPSDSVQQIATFAAILHATNVQVTHLEQALGNATAISLGLQGVLTASLNSCNAVSARLHKQILRLHADNATDADPTYIQSHSQLLAIYQSLFQCLADILVINERDAQDAALNRSKTQELIQQSNSSFNAVLQPQSILLEASRVHETLPDVNSLPHRPKHQPLEQDQPPPYAHTDPSSSGSQPGGGTPQSSEVGPSYAPAAESIGFSFAKTFKALVQPFMSKPDPFVSALCQAVTNGDIRQITGLISQGININGKGEHGNTPLQCAILADQEQAADVLLSAGANYGSGGWGLGMPPMFQAAAAGRIGIAQLLMDKGIKPTEKSVSGQPYFIDVIASNNIDGIRFLLEAGANPNAANIAGRPALILAVRQANIELVELLIKFGAKINASDFTGSSILAIASEKDDLNMIQTLLNHGAKPNGEGMTGVPVLVDAILRRRLDLAHLLLDHGAKGKADDITGQPVIIIVVKDAKMKPQDKVSLVQRLLENGASANAKDMVWSRPVLTFALEFGLPEIVESLLEYGAKPTCSMSSGEPALLYAVKMGKVSEANALLEHGADPNKKDQNGRTPLVEAVIKQDKELIKLLMDHGADVHARGTVSIASFAAALQRPDILNLLGLGNGGMSGAINSEAMPPGYQASAKS